MMSYYYVEENTAPIGGWLVCKMPARSPRRIVYSRHEFKVDAMDEANRRALGDNIEVEQ